MVTLEGDQAAGTHPGFHDRRWKAAARSFHDVRPKVV
jgi:hypothetical protein